MQVELSAKGMGLGAYATKLKGMSSLTQLEMSRALNAAGDKTATIVRRRMVGQMGLVHQPYQTILANTKTSQSRPGQVMTYRIIGTGAGLPIQDFLFQASKGAPVSAAPWGVERTFTRSFMTSIRGALRARRGKERMPIRSLRGPSPAKELLKDKAAEGFNEAARALVEPMIMTQLAKLLPR